MVMICFCMSSKDFIFLVHFGVDAENRGPNICIETFSIVSLGCHSLPLSGKVVCNYSINAVSSFQVSPFCNCHKDFQQKASNKGSRRENFLELTVAKRKCHKHFSHQWTGRKSKSHQSTNSLFQLAIRESYETHSPPSWYCSRQNCRTGSGCCFSSICLLKLPKKAVLQLCLGP